MLAVGDLLDTVDIAVERGKIREFVRATAATDPAHTDQDAAIAAGFDSVPATLTHSVVTGHARDQRAFVAALGLAIERIVVGSVAWEYARPLVAGDVLRAERRVESDVEKQGRSGRMRVVTLATTFTDAADVVVMTQREVLIERTGAA